MLQISANDCNINKNILKDKVFMIVSRKYVPFTTLFRRDMHVKSVLENAFNNSNLSATEKERIWKNMFEHMLSINTASLGSGIPNFDYIKNELERLDEEYPYDSGFSLSDINEIAILEKSDDFIKLELVHRTNGAEDIVGIIKITEEKH